MNPENFVLLIIACLAVKLSPGPSVLLVSSVSAAQGLRAGIFAVLGMTAGAFVHVVLAASGVTVGVTRTRDKFAALVQRWLPGGVVIFLGLRLLWQEH